MLSCGAEEVGHERDYEGLRDRLIEADRQRRVPDNTSVAFRCKDYRINGPGRCGFTRTSLSGAS
jgi:hypothetical protein